MLHYDNHAIRKQSRKNIQTPRDSLKEDATLLIRLLPLQNNLVIPLHSARCPLLNINSTHPTLPSWVRPVSLSGAWDGIFNPSRSDRSLVTNVPKEIMAFFGFPYPAELPSFTTHRQVHDYLCSYAEQYDITPLIKFGCTVKSVRPVEWPSPEAGVNELADENERRWKGALGTWEVTYDLETTDSGESQDQEDESDGSGAGAGVVGSAAGKGTGNHSSSYDDGVPTMATEIFDAVCVCSGHFEVTFMPEFEGLSGFKGTTMHSRAYDRPNVVAFVDRSVLCVGSMSSGTDIAREISSVGELCMWWRG